MIKTIEFVENEIEFYQLKINKAKEEKVYRETIALLFPENKNINLATVNEIEISLNEYKIKCLQQIKCELEAWEELKKYIIIKEGHNVYFDSTYEYIELENGCIDESNSEEEGVSIISIKKALEVKDASI